MGFMLRSAFLVVLVCLVIGDVRSIKDGTAQLEVEKLLVTFYYETECPDCKEFFRTNFSSSMLTKGRLEYTDLQLVPCGWAEIHRSSNNELEIKCQHGEVECQNNALHACIYETIPNITKVVEVILCLEGGGSISKCASKFNLNMKLVTNCLDSRTIAEILLKYYHETKAAKIPYVPSIGFDGELERNPEQQQILQDHFDMEFCKAYKKKFGKTLDDCKFENDANGPEIWILKDASWKKGR